MAGRNDRKRNLLLGHSGLGELSRIVYAACMFKRRTLFVVGAGASQEAGFPVGSELAKRIGDGLKIVGDTMERTARFTDVDLFSEIRRSLGQDPERQLNKYGDAAQVITTGITLSNSIDDFLNIHSNNPYVIQLGKASIVRVILNAEKDSDLYINQSNIYNKLDFGKVDQTWFVKLMRVLGPGGSPDTVEAVFKNLSFIVFNYDRCLEHFLANAISALYSIEREASVEIVKKITIIHPYGTIGELDRVPFGGDQYNAPSVLPLAKRIKTYAEQFEEPDELQRMHHEMHNAACIVFLGLSYLEQNMKLLKPTNPMDDKTVLGTAFGMSPNDRDVVTREILKMFAEPQASNMRSGKRVLIDTGTKCAQLFDSYARTLNAA
jgi:hypothetical protein